VKIPGFLVMTPCGLVYSYHRFGEACRLRLYGRKLGIMYEVKGRHQYDKPNVFCHQHSEAKERRV
jgi:hypothetical protein